MKSIYDIIKKQHGETFARVIRQYDNGIFDIDGLPRILEYAGRNPLPLLKFLESLKKIEIKDIETGKNPFELLDEAGYDAFLADTFEKQNMIAPYYKQSEALCTFVDKTRYLRYYVVHAVKRGAEKLNRDDFKGKEAREDEYGTSVISIQILKEGGFISIKNRYNHGVENSDNTFNSNPDNIIPGLSTALKRYFNVDFSSSVEELPCGYAWEDGRIFKYHQETANIKFGNGFFLKNGKFYLLNPDKTIVVDDMIIDLQKKIVYSPFRREDNLPELIEKELNKGVVRLSKKTGEKSIIVSGNLILKIKENRLSELYLPTCDIVGKKLFCHHEKIEVFSAPKMPAVEGEFFCACPQLKKVSLPCVKKTDKSFLVACPLLQEVDMPSLTHIGAASFVNLDSIEKLVFYSLEEVGSSSFTSLPNLEEIKASRLKKINSNVFRKLFKIKEIHLLNLTEIENGCFTSLPRIKTLDLPNLKRGGDYVFSAMPEVENLSLPILEQVGSCAFNKLGIRRLKLPELFIAMDDCFSQNKKIELLELPKLKEMGEGGISYNKSLLGVDISSLTALRRETFKENPCLKMIKADNLNEVAPYSSVKFLTHLNLFYAPKLNDSHMWSIFHAHDHLEKILSRKMPNFDLLMKKQHCK